VLAAPIVGGLLENGAFGSASTALTADALRGFALGLVPFSVYLYTLRLFYAHHDTKTPFLINLGENVLNLALAVPLFDRYGLVGLAASYAIAYTVAAAAAGFVAARRFGVGLDRRTWSLGGPVVVGALAAGFVADGIRQASDSGPFVVALLGTLTIALLYLLVLYLCRIPDLTELGRVVRRKPGPAAPPAGHARSDRSAV
jgi:putative peptidoglycan lipid II flippase